MITAEEREEIINAAVEKALLLLPDTVGTLMANQAALFRLNKEFYKKYPEFSDHREIVQTVMEKIDGENTLEDYDKKVEKAVPEIRERIKLMGKVDLKKVSKDPDRRYSSNGAL